MLQITDVVKSLLIINVIVFFGVMFLPENFQDWFKLYHPVSDHFQPLQLVTHMFNHGGPMHLFFNMFGLFMFGPPLESLWGPKRFLLFYLICGFGAAALHLGVGYYECYQLLAEADVSSFQEFRFNYEQRGVRYSESLLDQARSVLIPVVGASGALYGVLVGYGMHFPNAKLALIFFPVPVAAKYFIPGLLLLDFIGGFTGFSIFGQNIAHFAHIGGALFGFIMILSWQKFGSRL